MINSDHRKIMVPYDFSEQSEYAVKHAVQIAKVIGGEIIFLHVISDLKEEATALNRLQCAADEFIKKYGVHIDCKIRHGRVSTVVRTFAETIDALMVVMKTQEPVGKEKYFGTRTIRVMIGSKIPFFVVQGPPKRLALRRVVFPIDFRSENKEKLAWISFLSKYYTSKIYLYKPNVHDYNVRNNLEFAKRFLEGKDIDYEIVNGKNYFAKPDEIVEYANEIKAEVIIIMLSKNITKAKLLLGLNDQKYISNKYQIPVICINPRMDLRKLQGFF